MKLILKSTLGTILLPFAIIAAITIVIYYDLNNRDLPIYQDTGEDV